MKSFSVKNGFGFGAVIFAVATLIALPLRTSQFFGGVLERKTGFYSDINASVIILSLVLAAAILFFIIYGIIKRKKLDFDRELKKRPVFAVFSFIGMAGFFFDGINNAMTFANDYTPLINKEYDFLGNVTSTWNAEKLFCGIEAVFAILSAIFLLAIGVAAIKGKTDGSEHKLIALAPVILCIIKLVYRFSRTISYLRVSDLTFELLMFVFMVMFFMAFAQSNAKIGNKGSEWKIAGYGLSAALLAFVCFVPRLIVTLTGNDALLYEYSPVDFGNFTTALFIIAAVFTRITDKTEKSDYSELSETADTDEVPSIKE